MEIVLRAVVIFFFLWLITRAVGRSTLGELSTFELLLYVTMGDLVQQAVTQQDYSITAGVLAIGTFALLTTALSWTQWRFPKVRPMIVGRPVLIMSDGECDEREMRRQRVTITDLLASMREQGIARTAQVQYAVLETDGRISFFTRDHQDNSGAPDKPPQG